MVRRSHSYPQVAVRAEALVDVSVAAVPEGIRVAGALRLARRRNARLLVTGARCVLREDLVRAAALGLGHLRAVDLARALPIVESGADEVRVRRALAAGSPLVLIRERRAIVGAVAGNARRRGPTPVASLAIRFVRSVPEEVRAVLETAAEVAATHGARAFAVGGLVRDVQLGGPTRRSDLDIVVEGDGLTVARHLADVLHGPLVEHRRFLTASVEAPGVGRVDVATARTERYETPGALPRVAPATIAHDLGRRDFSINAMAVELGSGGFGLLDPEGGRVDLARRRLRVLHPLSYVEDPTRMFRASRYAIRLGLRPDRNTRSAQALALRLAPYAALSGQRLVTELWRALAEERSSSVLVHLAEHGVLRLLHPRYRADAATRRRLAELSPALGWARDRGLDVEPLELAVLALVAAQPPAIANGVLDRLGLAGEPRARIERSMAGAPGRVRALRAASTPSARARLLRPCSPVEVAWLWLVGGCDEPRSAPVRRMVEWFSGLDRAHVALTGADLIALGVPRGPKVARILEAIRDRRLDGAIADRAGEEKLVRAWVTKGGGWWSRNSSS